MEKFSQKVSIILMSVLMLAGVLVFSSQTNAIDIAACSDQSVSQSAICKGKNEDIKSSDGFVKNLTNTLLFILGVVSVIAIIFGGIRYTTANGDASQVKSAKDIIMYAVVGLVVALMAWGIVSFVVNRF